MGISEYRESEHNINDIFINRWSPRAMSGETISDDELFSLLEAARWAPSSYNNQPWRFVYAKRDTEHWDKLFNFLLEGNQTWVKDAAVLVVLISKTTSDHNGSFMRTHSFDTGAAWENLALQGSINGFVIHGMQGLDYDRATSELGVPDEYKVEMMFAIGKPGKTEDLPEKLQKIEKPSGRKKISEIVSEGKFDF
ncbi:MAG: nitroreductase family protein [Thermodesulfobacteriota bacterium]